MNSAEMCSEDDINTCEMERKPLHSISYLDLGVPCRFSLHA